MTNINPIRFGVGANYAKREGQEEITQGSKKEAESSAAQQKKVASSEVLGYMAAMNIDLVPVKQQKIIDVEAVYAKASPETISRMEDLMANFEENFDSTIAIVNEEFPDLSEEVASGIALEYLNTLA